VVEHVLWNDDHFWQIEGEVGENHSPKAIRVALEVSAICFVSEGEGISKLSLSEAEIPEAAMPGNTNFLERVGVGFGWGSIVDGEICPNFSP
jgi:hypothetical protein